VNLDGINAAPFTATVTTTARSMVVPRTKFPPPTAKHRGVPLLVWLLMLVTLAMFAAARRQRVNLGLAPAVLLVALWAACGGGGSVPPPPPKTGTLAGTYTLTVTGTSSGVSRSTTLTLKVN
jgi:hypothetical protein